MRWLYDIILSFYTLGIRIAALFNPKASAWIKGRKDLFEKLEKSGIGNTEKLIWIHAASLGEFEQGRPIIEQLKKHHPQCKILLTFFSPSGYKIRKDYELADFVSYLPIDSKNNAKRFIQIANPQLVIFIKYELWYHFLNELQQAKIPTILVAALFRKNQFFFKSYGQWFKKVLLSLDHIFVQNKSSKTLLQQHGISKTSISGDTRIDRVATLVKQKNTFPIVEAFTNKSSTLICGSTWPADEAIIQYYINKHPKKWRYIIAPHDISEHRIKHIENLFRVSSIRYSQAKGLDLKNYDLLIIDNIGILSALYQYGKVAYIGGAFGSGLHNTLEPIAFGLPVIFGSQYQKFEEAKYLVENGGGFSIRSAPDFQKIMKLFETDTFYNNASKQAINYIHSKQGATEKILKHITI